MGSEVRGVLFDLDGTLFDHRGSATAGLESWLPTLGLSADPRTIKLWFALEDKYVAQWLDKKLTWHEQRRLRLLSFFEAVDVPRPATGQLDVVFGQWLAAYRAAWTSFSDVPGALADLEALGIPTAILTNGSTSQQQQKLDAIGISHLVGPLLTAEDLGQAKPNPSTYLAGCELLGMKPADVLHVGDMYDLDVEGAVNAGLKAVQIDRALFLGALRSDQLTTLAHLTAFIRRISSAE